MSICNQKYQINSHKQTRLFVYPSSAFLKKKLMKLSCSTGILRWFFDFFDLFARQILAMKIIGILRSIYLTVLVVKLPITSQNTYMAFRHRHFFFFLFSQVFFFVLNFDSRRFFAELWCWLCLLSFGTILTLSRNLLFSVQWGEPNELSTLV